MKPQEKLPIVSTNINAINFRPQAVNPSAEDIHHNKSSKNVDKKIEKDIENFEKGVVDPNIFK